MTFLINASNLKNGGGIQVAQSICEQLRFFKNLDFVIVLSSYINDSIIELGDNCKLFRHDVSDSIYTILTGRERFLDNLIKENNVDAVLTVFGPSKWTPRVPHLCGFARAHLVLTDSPYYKRISWKEKLLYRIWKVAFKRSSRFFYTENEHISDLLSNLLKGSKVYTVTNYYNQVFDKPETWNRQRQLPLFSGTTCLSVSTYYPHKNFPILIDVIRNLNQIDSSFKVRFILTFNKEEMPVPEESFENFVFLGKVDVSECPYLYEQCDIMFMPTLMECFTATYPEAMKMGKPIVTPDLEFARGLCGEAACYYSAVDAKAAAEAIYRVAKDKEYAQQLVDNGKQQLLSYDNYEQRAKKLVSILKDISTLN